MKNTGKNRSEADSCTVSEAARLLGVSIPTVRRMEADRQLEGFRTPGGHLRITSESIEALREQRQTRLRPVREASPVLQNRRERLEELTLEAQEHRARQELERLRSEEQEEADRRETEALARDQELRRRQAELKLERDRIEIQRLREQHDICGRQDAAEQLREFRSRWMDKAGAALSASQYRCLSAGQRKEVVDGLQALIQKWDPLQEHTLERIFGRSLEALIEPLKAERDAQETRQRLTQDAVTALPYSATEAERTRARGAIREALKPFDTFADVAEMREAIRAAVWPVRQAIEKRLLDIRLADWATAQLPWARTERDKLRLQRECTEILAELPVDICEAEAKEALEATIQEARHEIEQRESEKAREVRKAELVEDGLAEVDSYLLHLKRHGEISAEEYRDSELTADLKEAVQSELESELSGSETSKEVRELTREIIDGELQ